MVLFIVKIVRRSHMGNRIEITGEDNKKEDEIEFLDLHFLIFIFKKN